MSRKKRKSPARTAPPHAATFRRDDATRPAQESHVAASAAARVYVRPGTRTQARRTSPPRTPASPVASRPTVRRERVLLTPPRQDTGHRASMCTAPLVHEARTTDPPLRLPKRNQIMLLQATLLPPVCHDQRRLEKCSSRITGPPGRPPGRRAHTAPCRLGRSAAAAAARAEPSAHRIHLRLGPEVLHDLVGNFHELLERQLSAKVQVGFREQLVNVSVRRAHAAGRRAQKERSYARATASPLSARVVAHGCGRGRTNLCSRPCPRPTSSTGPSST
eukprot:43797-Prymnesium_polylepis.2